MTLKLSEFLKEPIQDDACLVLNAEDLHSLMDIYPNINVSKDAARALINAFQNKRDTPFLILKIEASTRQPTVLIF